MNIEQGIWYRRKTGGMYGARRVPIDPDMIEFWPLHPNTLEEEGVRKVLPDEHFFCFYCRKEAVR